MRTELFEDLGLRATDIRRSTVDESLEVKTPEGGWLSIPDMKPVFLSLGLSEVPTDSGFPSGYVLPKSLLFWEKTKINNDMVLDPWFLAMCRRDALGNKTDISNAVAVLSLPERAVLSELMNTPQYRTPFWMCPNYNTDIVMYFNRIGLTVPKPFDAKDWYEAVQRGGDQR